MANKTKVFQKDGKTWKFVPGENGSMTQIRSTPIPRPGLTDIPVRRAKVIMAEGLDKKRPHGR